MLRCCSWKYSVFKCEGVLEVSSYNSYKLQLRTRNVNIYKHKIILHVIVISLKPKKKECRESNVICIALSKDNLNRLRCIFSSIHNDLLFVYLSPSYLFGIEPYNL